MARSDGFSGLSEFLAVARHASFRAAAAELGVTPAAVSQAIRVLEAKTGLVLFQRTTRRVGLTEAGEQLLDARAARRGGNRRRVRSAHRSARPASGVAAPFSSARRRTAGDRNYAAELPARLSGRCGRYRCERCRRRSDGEQPGRRHSHRRTGRARHDRRTPDSRPALVGARCSRLLRGARPTENAGRADATRVHPLSLPHGRLDLSLGVRARPPGVFRRSAGRCHCQRWRADDVARAQRNGTDLHGRSVRGARSRGRATGIGAARIPADEPGPVSVLPRAHANATEAARVHRHDDGGSKRRDLVGVRRRVPALSRCQHCICIMAAADSSLRCVCSPWSRARRTARSPLRSRSTPSSSYAEPQRQVREVDAIQVRVGACRSTSRAP